MAEYIERKPVFEDICVEEERAHRFRCPMGADAASFRAGMLTAFGLARGIIDRKKAADVEPVRHGRWEKSDKYKGFRICSACRDCYVRRENLTDGKWGFCPNCGAKMDGGADSD